MEFNSLTSATGNTFNLVETDEVINASEIAQELGWNTQLIISESASYECVDDLTGQQCADNRLRKLVIAANYARKSGRKRFELSVLDASLNLTTKLLDIKNEGNFTLIDIRF